MTKQPRLDSGVPTDNEAVTFIYKGKAFNPRLLDHRAAITDYLERLPFGMLKSSTEVADALGIPRGTVSELAREFPKNYYKDATYNTHCFWGTEQTIDALLERIR